MRNKFNARPHPDPLPRGEGTAMHVFGKLVRHGCNHSASALSTETWDNLTVSAHTCGHRMFLPLLGERAGVRAVITFSN